MSPDERPISIFDVRPTFPAQGSLKHAKVHSIFASHLSLAGQPVAPSSADVSHDGVSELRPRAPLAIGMGAVCQRVRHVVGPRRPPEIAHAIVEAIAVVMRPVKAIAGRRANKRHQHQSVGAIQLARAIAAQTIKQVTASLFNVSGKPPVPPCALPGNSAAHLSAVAHFIARKAGNFFPLHRAMVPACLPKCNIGGR